MPGAGFDFWGDDNNDLSDVLAKGAKAWSAPLIGPLGPCGEIAFALGAGASVPGEGRVASALASSVHALNGACGADHIGEMQRAEPHKLLEPRPGQRALAVPLSSGDQPAGLLVVIISASEVAAELPHLDPSPGPRPGPAPSPP